MLFIFDQLSKKIRRDCSGAIAPLFGLMVMVLLIAMAGAVDCGRWLHARNITISAMDSAVLAAGRSLQIDADDRAGAIARAQAFYRENIKSRMPVESDTVSFVISDDGKEVSAVGNATIETFLLGFAQIDTLHLLNKSGTDYSKSVIEKGVNSRTNIEISIMLDVTGSMSGSKIEAMKEAAKELVDIAVWDDQSSRTSKVALVPFAHAVNLGSTYFNAITNRMTYSTLASIPPKQDSRSHVPISHKLNLAAAIKLIRDFKFVQPAWAASSTPSIINELTRPPSSDASGGENPPTPSSDAPPQLFGDAPPQYFSPCVVGRDGMNASTDEVPSNGDFFSVFDLKKRENLWSMGIACSPGNVAIQPLTNNKSLLNSKIDSLQAFGGTAGHLGTAFTWYMLSPKWADIWPAESKPAQYNEEGTIKHAILLSDGDYNIWFNSDSNGTSSQQAAHLCTNMKAKGIKVFTIAFALHGGSEARGVLSKCATDPEKHFDPKDAEELKQTFRSIALDITKLHLSH